MFWFGRDLERLGLQLAILLQKNFDLAFSFLELFAAGVGELHAFFKQLKRLFERNFTALQLVYYFLETLQTFFKLRQG